ncbi:MAG: RpiB/LacA/LacB family sugar-phosphate isomerase [Ardenticatenaceae bacterium]|nr:RpiB/LacA/LacB family sugar-phosphate isomerase [Ardenticatenaceae bacterium]
MKISVGADDRSHLTDQVIADLRSRGHELTLFGHLTEAGGDWPRIAQEVAEAVANGECDEGILFCWTGTGVSIAANKVPGIRAALCDEAETARGARLWNNANVLCLSLRRLSEVKSKEVLDAWFEHAYEPNESDDACLAQIESLEQKYKKPV